MFLVHYHNWCCNGGQSLIVTLKRSLSKKYCTKTFLLSRQSQWNNHYAISFTICTIMFKRTSFANRLDLKSMWRCQIIWFQQKLHCFAKTFLLQQFSDRFMIRQKSDFATGKCKRVTKEIKKSRYRLPTPLTKFGKTKPRPDEILIGQYRSHTTPHLNFDKTTPGALQTLFPYLDW